MVFKSTSGQLISHSGDSSTNDSNHSSLNDDEDQLLSVLYLLDRFAVSDQFYHEISMTNKSLPRSYLIKRARERINSEISIMRLPKPFFGCYRSLTESIQDALAAQVYCTYTLMHLSTLSPTPPRPGPPMGTISIMSCY